jgi:hypothetical protein
MHMVSDREALDKQILAGERVPVDTLKDVLAGETPPSGDLRIRYAERLLTSALETRDPDTMEQAADMMDAEPAIDQALDRILNDTLLDQPDAVYAFVRAHIPKNSEKRWLRRLKLSALFSLRVAINDADTETIVSWLTLVAREPANYDLGDVLHFGILSAQERAHQDPELARQLVLLAAKRDPANLDILLNDPALMVALPNNIGLCLRDMSGDAVQLLQNRGAEIFLVAMARAARARSGTMFTPASMAKVWELYTAGQPVGLLPAAYQPESIVTEWVEHGAEFLKPETLEIFLVLSLSSRRDDLILSFFRQPNATASLLSMLVPALEQAQRNINEALDLVGRLAGADIITPHQAANVIIDMLDGQEWGREGLPLMQQLARMTQQFPSITLTPDVLWKLLNAAGEIKDEFIARTAIKRLVGNLETVEDEVQLTESLRQMAAQTTWSENVRQNVTNWWRGFARQQSMNRLGRLDRALEGKRSLDSEHDIVNTLIALRRMLGGRSLQEFATDVKTTFTILESLAESFDPNTKRSAAFDPPTIRDELNAREDQISPETRQILANNLKELAHVIAGMGDNRTKSNLIRRGDDLDRDLMSGEQPPHSAVDAMKWLSGYWGATREETSADQNSHPPTPSPKR